jgi:FKBP12-rapamycin complex-associated protein
MFYSVIWSTEEHQQSKTDAADMTAKEELWLARLGSWTDALAVYENKLSRNPNDPEAILGCMRCLGAVGEWRKVLELAHENWGIMSGTLNKLGDGVGHGHTNPRSKRKALRICAQSAWRLGQWDKLEKFATQLVGSSSHQPHQPIYSSVDYDGAFYSAVLHVHRKEWGPAAEAIDGARKAMDSRLTALMAESYSRAYPSMVTAQTLAEMEEIIEFHKLEEHALSSDNQHPANRPDAERARARLLSVWRDRLAGCRMDADVHASILAVRSLVVKPEEEVEATLTLSNLSRQAQQFKYAERVLLDSLEALNADLDGPVFGLGLPPSLRTSHDYSSVPAAALPNIVDNLLAGDFKNIVLNYGSTHEQWSKKLVAEAGGLQR